MPGRDGSRFRSTFPATVHVAAHATAQEWVKPIGNRSLPPFPLALEAEVQLYFRVQGELVVVGFVVELGLRLCGEDVRAALLPGRETDLKSHWWEFFDVPVDGSVEDDPSSSFVHLVHREEMNGSLGDLVKGQLRDSTCCYHVL